MTVKKMTMSQRKGVVTHTHTYTESHRITHTHTHTHTHNQSVKHQDHSDIMTMRGGWEDYSPVVQSCVAPTVYAPGRLLCGAAWSSAALENWAVWGHHTEACHHHTCTITNNQTHLPGNPLHILMLHAKYTKCIFIDVKSTGTFLLWLPWKWS